MKIVLTGVAGVLGAPLCRVLTDIGYEVRGVDRKTREDLPITVEVADLLDRELCYELLQGADAVVHLANHSSEHLADKQRLLNENVTMNTNVFQAARELGIKTVVFASSIQAIGAGKEQGDETVPTLAYLPIDGELPAKPTNVYGLSKQMSEEMLRYYGREAEMNCVALRFPFLARNQKHANRFLHGMSTDKINEVWSYLSINDACALIVAFLHNPLPGFRIYCPAARDNGVAQPPAQLIERYFPTTPLKQPLQTIDSLIDISRICEETGWEPQDQWILPIESKSVVETQNSNHHPMMSV
ncbi:NAD(P)-dependent oxidoreductase [bacterium]|nr:MAG: NAD(P)-dependent oxidoreductase [bacterium]